MEYKDQQKVNEKPNSIQSLLKILIDNEDQSLNSDQLRDIQTELNKELHNKEEIVFEIVRDKLPQLQSTFRTVVGIQNHWTLIQTEYNQLLTIYSSNQNGLRTRLQRNLQTIQETRNEIEQIDEQLRIVEWCETFHERFETLRIAIDEECYLEASVQLKLLDSIVNGFLMEFELQTSVCQLVQNEYVKLKNRLYDRLTTIFFEEQSQPFFQSLLSKSIENIEQDQIEQSTNSTSNETFSQIIEALQNIGLFEQQIDQFWKQKRSELLAKARQILLSTNYQQIVQVGDYLNEENKDVILLFPRCRISFVAQQLVNYIRQLMSEACTSSLVFGKILISSIREIIELFQAILTTKYEDQLRENTKMAAIYHNDCMYLVHTLVLLKHQFSSKLSDELKQQTYFTDLIPFIQRSGESVLSRHLSQNTAQLMNKLNKADGFQNVHKPERQTQVDQAILQTWSYLCQISSFYQEILPITFCHRVMGILADSVLSTTIDQMSRLDDISEEETHILHSMLTVFLNISDLFPNVDLTKVLPHWLKYYTLREILEMSLLNIVERYETGKLHGFTAEETRKWIRTLFSETQFRQQNIERIK